MGLATNIRTGLTAGEIKQAFRENLRSGLGQLETFSTKHDFYVALALTHRRGRVLPFSTPRGWENFLRLLDPRLLRSRLEH
jgi:hypothetical protein